MAELIHTFTGGKMNKDLDERLVPNGEYRDALNLEIASSETSQVGAFQNIKGNLELKYKTYNENTGVRTEWSDNDYITALSNPVCIGSKADENSDNIYWFIASDNVSVVATYNTVTKLTLPLVVDTQSILNFSPDLLITGINILEGMLLWTDNQTEPKKITIKDWVGSTPNFFTHSKIYGANRSFIESDLTVIKKYPLQPPTITAYPVANTLDGVVINIDTQSTASFLEDINGSIFPKNPESGPQTMTWIGQNLPVYGVDDVLVFTLVENETGEESAVVRCQVNSIIGSPSTQTGAIVTILSVGPNTSLSGLSPDLYDVTLEQEAPFFEFKFARFGYRYKYKSNEVSAFSPFTNPAFIPGEFDYEPKQGYNLGMTNNVRQLEISNFTPSTMPIDVERVDVLYKASNNQNVYVVDTFTESDPEWNTTTGGLFSIKTEIITAAVMSNQLLRPYDNVPKRALAQEVTANRLIYGNYTQNFNLKTVQGNIQQVSLSASLETKTISIGTDSTGTPLGVNTYGNNVYKSIKSIRTYQIGVAYMDDYGRTTPVFTSANAAYILSKAEASNANSLIATVNSDVPYYEQGKQFPYFKYYIKETSQEYYNLALDRFYDAEDGNIWLSFPSAERNKVDEETFIILKKEHDNDNPVTEEARYKIIAIENEAPAYLKETKLSKGTMNGSFPVQGVPVEGQNHAWVNAIAFDETYGDKTRSTSGLMIRFLGGAENSEYYRISSMGLSGDITDSNTYTIITVSEKFGPDVNFAMQPDGVTPTSGVLIEILETESINKPEFTGRFFVKVNQDTLLTEKVANAAASIATSYVRKAIAPTYYLQGPHVSETFWYSGAYWYGDDGQQSKERLFIDNIYADCNRGDTGIGITANTMDISWAGGYGAGKQRGLAITNPNLLQALNTNGILFRFINYGNGKEDPNGTIYRVNNSIEHLMTNQDCSDGANWAGDQYNDSRNQYTRWSISFSQVEDGFSGIDWNPTTAGDGILPWTTGVSNWDPYFVGIEFLSIDLENTERFTTENPAIFETEPKEATELDIYYEIPVAYTKAEHGNPHSLDWFNCYSFGNGVESDRIRDDYNQPVIGDGVKASAVLDEPYQEETRLNGLIFSQIFNSVSGLNGLNQFIQAESITKDVNPEYGSIQKLHSRDTNLVTLCENKSMKILANKDALYNADGSTNITSNRAVLGQTITFQGEYGIATNPESFAEFGFRMYFTDANRGSVIRLSNDGITEVSEYGMRAFFSDNLNLNKKIIGSWDMERKNYNVTLSDLTPYWQQTLGAGQFDRLNKDPLCDQFVNSKPTATTTISFKEDVKGWTSRKTYIPEASAYLNNIYYTFKDGRIWEHNANPLYNTFYGIGPAADVIGPYYESSFNAIFNESPSVIKSFKTLNYSGTDSRKNVYKLTATGDLEYSLAQVQAAQIIPTSKTTSKGWYANSVITDLQEGQVNEFLDKEGKYFNYIKGLGTFFTDNCDNNVSTKEFNVQGIGRANSIVVPPVTDFIITNQLDPDCYVELVAPILTAQSFSTIQNIVGSFAVAQSNTCVSGVEFELVTDATTGGILAFNQNGSFTFTPDTGYIGDGGNFTVRVCCGGICSNNASMGINITSPAATSITVRYSSVSEEDLCCETSVEKVIWIAQGGNFNTSQFFKESTLITVADAGWYSNDLI